MRSYAGLLPPKARYVVEFGCGDGSTGREFKMIQPACRYVGVDQDETLLQMAAGYLDQTAQDSFVQMDLKRHGIQKADCFLYHSAFCADELLAERLKEQAVLLPEGGQMVFVWENSGYFRNVMSLWQGRAPLAQSRLPLSGLLQAVEAAGMKVDRVSPQYASADQELREQPAAKQLLDAFVAYCRTQRINVHTDVWAEYFVVRAVKQADIRPRTLVQAMLGEVRVTASSRILVPARFLETIPGVHCLEQVRGAGLAAGDAYPRKLLIRQRVRFPDVKSSGIAIRQLMQRGYLLLSEMDDHPMLWQKAYTQTHFVDFAGCHAMQVSTPALADYMRQYNPNVAVFANQLRVLPPARVYPPDGPVTLFFGALNRTEDWQDIMPVLNKVLKKYGSGLQVKVIFDTKFYEALQTEHKEMIGQEFPDGYVPYPVYERTLYHSDIALLPLHDTPFNRMKSDLKFIECAGHGLAVLASPTVYADTVRDGRTGFLYHDVREFQERLTMLIENRQRRIETAEAAYAYVKHNRMLAQHYEERIAYYDALFAQKAELDQALLARLSALENLKE